MLMTIHWFAYEEFLTSSMGVPPAEDSYFYYRDHREDRAVGCKRYKVKRVDTSTTEEYMSWEAIHRNYDLSHLPNDGLLRQEYVSEKMIAEGKYPCGVSPEKGMRYTRTIIEVSVVPVMSSDEKVKW